MSLNITYNNEIWDFLMKMIKRRRQKTYRVYGQLFAGRQILPYKKFGLQVVSYHQGTRLRLTVEWKDRQYRTQILESTLEGEVIRFAKYQCLAKSSLNMRKRYNHTDKDL